MAKILITGGRGLIGETITEKLVANGYSVSILSRNKSLKPNEFYWNISTNYIDKNAFKNIDFIIHLAGAGIADKRWTSKRKETIINSRINSTNLLFKKIKEYKISLKGFIAASAIGYYGAITSKKIFIENDESGNDFLSEVCKHWEKASFQFKELKIRTVILRTGVVFSKKGGAFEKISKPIKLGIGSPIGKGNQYIPWIHIDDLCEMYINAIENVRLNGVYNAVAPNHCTNKQLTKEIANTLNKPIWLPNIPSFLLKLIFGKMAIMLLEGSRVSSEKIKETGFKFKFPKLGVALNNLIN